MELHLCRGVGVASAHRAGKPRQAAACHAILARLGEHVAAATFVVVARAVEGPDRAGGEARLLQTAFTRMGASREARQVEGHRKEQGSPVGVPEPVARVDEDAQGRGMDRLRPGRPALRG